MRMDIISPEPSSWAYFKMKNFTQIENERVFDRNISDGAFRTYLVIRSFWYGNNQVFPSLKTIAELRGKSVKSITSHNAELVQAGYIKKKKRGYSASNEYLLIGIEPRGHKKKTYYKEKNYYSILNKTSTQHGRKVQPNNTEMNNIEINNISVKQSEKSIEYIKNIREILLKKMQMPNGNLKN